jgi:molecular chaperone DnaK (HSP70)
MDKSRLVYGIDLGTTYSCIAQVDKFDQAVVIANFEGDTTTPSVVHFGDNVVVGKEAKNLSADEPERTVSFIKRHIGVDESFKKPTPFPNGLDPVEISSLILKKLVLDANASSDSPEPVKDVVITCPAYFGTKQIMQTKQAGIIAGLNVLAIINEPTAAAISYGLKVKERKMILVYDLGGGTFDVTIIRVDGATIKVIATGGDDHLGGVDWDTEIAKYMLGVYNAEHHTDYTLDSDACLKNALLLEVEQKKKTLTAKAIATAKVNANVQYKGVSSRVEITRELFDLLTESKLNETIDKTKEVIKIAQSKGFNAIDEVLLVGGSSRMPQVKERVDRELDCDARLEDPDQCVAKGAAIYALNEAYAKAITDFENDDTGRVEKPKSIAQVTRAAFSIVTSKTYGTDIVGNKVSNLIFANTSLPAKAVDTFYTHTDNQSGVSVKVFESDVTDVEKDENGEPKDKIIEDRFAKLLEDKSLSFSKKYREKTPIKVIFEIDREGILSVHAEAANEDPLDFTLKIKGVRTQEELVAATEKMSGYIFE